MNSAEQKQESRLLLCICAILAIGTVAAYWPVWRFDFVNFDDPLYVSENPSIALGLSWGGIVWAFKSMVGGLWQPMVWLSYLAETHLHGTSPGGFHAINLLLHIINALLLLLILKQMTGMLWPSAFAAALFSWHPMHVESVAWITERKDVLSALFLLLTIWQYNKYAKGPKRKLHYILAVLFFAMGLMSKAILVTAPCILLLLDYWPLQRKESFWRLLLEKIPMIVLTVIASIWTFVLQKDAGGVISAASLPLSWRMENATLGYGAYLEKFFWPMHMAAFYPFPRSFDTWKVFVIALVFLAVTVLAICEVRKHRYLAVGWFWFLGTMLPVCGLVQSGDQAMADRFTYIPYIGLTIMLTWAAADLIKAWPPGKFPLAFLGAMALACCVVVTQRQTSFWQGSESLYAHTVDVTSNNFLTHSFFGKWLRNKGRLDEAASHFQEVIRISPDWPEGYNDLALTYESQNQVDDAIAMYRKAIQLKQGFAEAHRNLGNAFLRKGDTPAAIEQLQEAVRLDSEDMIAQSKLGDAYLSIGEVAKALPYCKAVLAARPNNPRSYYSLGWAYLNENQPEEALVNFEKAIRLAPDSSMFLIAPAWIYATNPKAEVRNGAEAVRLATKACELTHWQDPKMLDTLSAAYAEAGQFTEAIKTAEATHDLAISMHNEGATQDAQKKLELFKAGKPYRDN